MSKETKGPPPPAKTLTQVFCTPTGGAGKKKLELVSLLHYLIPHAPPPAPASLRRGTFRRGSPAGISQMVCKLHLHCNCSFLHRMPHLMLMEGTGAASLYSQAHTDSRNSSAELVCRLTGQMVLVQYVQNVSISRFG